MCQYFEYRFGISLISRSVELKCARFWGHSREQDQDSAFRSLQSTGGRADDGSDTLSRASCLLGLVWFPPRVLQLVWFSVWTQSWVSQHKASRARSLTVACSAAGDNDFSLPRSLLLASCGLLFSRGGGNPKSARVSHSGIVRPHSSAG